MTGCSLLKFFKTIHLSIFIILLLGSGCLDLVYANEVQGKQLTPVTLQLKWRHQFQFAGYYTALEKGYYRDAGFDVTLQERREDVEAIDALANGDVDFIVEGCEGVLARLQGKPIILLASIFQHSSNVIITLSDNITDPHDLIGKKIALGMDPEVMAMLRSEGVGYDSVVYARVKDRVGALMNGEIDALLTYLSDGPYRLKQAKIPYNQIRPKSYGVDFYGDALYTNEHWAKYAPRQVEAFREASLRGWQYAMENQDEIIQLIHEKYATDLTLDYLKFEASQMQGLIMPELIQVGHINPGRIKQIAQIFVDLNMATEVNHLDDFVFSGAESIESKTLYYVVGILASIGILLMLGSVSLYQFNRRLRWAVRQQTGALEKVNAELLEDIDRRRKAEKALLESEKRLNTIVQATPVGIGIARDGRIIETNDHLCKIFGTERCDLIQRSIEQCFGSRLSSFMQAIETQTSDSLESQWRAGDGSTCDVVLNWVRLGDEQSEESIILFSVMDITDRKQAEESLRISERRYRTLVESLADGVLLIDRKSGQILDANNAALRIYGYDYSTLTSMHQQDLCCDKSHDETLTYEDNDEIRQGMHRRSNFATFPVEVSMSQIEWDGKELLLCVIRDVTRRQRAEEDLHRLATAVEQAAEVIVITDTEGFIEYVNPAFERVLGYSQSEAIGQHTRILKSGKHSKEFYKELWETISSGNTWTGRLTNATRSGKLVMEEASITPIKDPEGNIINYVAVKRDVSREHELVGQLRQSQKMEAIGTLAGGIAHDFNNILCALLGYSELVVEDAEDAKAVRSGMDQVLKAGKRAQDLVRQILAFSRQSESERIPMRIATIVNEAFKLLRGSVPSNIDIKLDVQEDCPIVLADATQLHQVIMNLGTNAYHAMREDGGEMAISLKAVDVDIKLAESVLGLKPGSYNLLTIRDTGSGIDAQALSRIYEPYYTTKLKGEGTGLGLAMVHSIVKGHDGAITVDSEVGVGTTFQVYLPVHYVAASSVDNPPGAEQEVRGSERILLVDDEPSIIEVGKRSLERLGYQVTIANSGREALEIFTDDPESFDFVVTDQIMPKLTGAALATRLLEIRPELPIVLCTGFSEIMTEESAKKMGLKALVMKPVVAKDLALTIRRVMNEVGVNPTSLL